MTAHHFDNSNEIEPVDLFKVSFLNSLLYYYLFTKFSRRAPEIPLL